MPAVSELTKNIARNFQSSGVFIMYSNVIRFSLIFDDFKTLVSFTNHNNKCYPIVIK